MRMIVKHDCEYQEFYDMRLEILRNTPFGLINSEYLKEDKIAYFYFWDTDYIPEEWKDLIVRPIATISKEKGISEEY